MRRAPTTPVRVATAAAAVLLLAACSSAGPATTASPTPKPTPTATPSPSPTATPIPTISADFVRRTSVTGLYSIAFPGTWTTVDLSSTDSTGVIDNAAKTSPEFQKYAAAMKLSGIAYDMVSFDVIGGSGSIRFASTVTGASGGLSIDFYQTMLETQAKQANGVTANFAAERVELPAGPALRATFSTATPAASGKTGTTMYAVEYVLIRGDKLYMIVFGSFAPPTAADLQVFAQVAGSFQFIG